MGQGKKGNWWRDNGSFFGSKNGRGDNPANCEAEKVEKKCTACMYGGKIDEEKTSQGRAKEPHWIASPWDCEVKKCGIFRQKYAKSYYSVGDYHHAILLQYSTYIIFYSHTLGCLNKAANGTTVTLRGGGRAPQMQNNEWEKSIRNREAQMERVGTKKEKGFLSHYEHTVAPFFTCMDWTMGMYVQ